MVSRRDFLKLTGLGAAALAGCAPKRSEVVDPAGTATGPIPTDQMTYRTFSGLAPDKVSILGYGCMRWPTMKNPDGEGEIIDQEAVNELVDYALELGLENVYIQEGDTAKESFIPDFCVGNPLDS